MTRDHVASRPVARRVHLTGIKGTGMTALAELLAEDGVSVTGSDVAERFYTDALLEAIGINPAVGFSAAHVPEGTELLVFSAAYDEDNAERRVARDRGIPQFSYSEMLAQLTASQPLLAVAGVHGKTTTTAMIGAMVAAAQLAGTVVVGSSVPDFGGSATLRRGRDFMVAETCEYRRHFLSFRPEVLIVTSVEADHLDYFEDRADVERAFTELVDRMPQGGTLVACADDQGASRIASYAEQSGQALTVVRYGRTQTSGPGAIVDIEQRPGELSFRLPSFGDGNRRWTLPIPGDHSILNATAALCGLAALNVDLRPDRLESWHGALASFHGTRRRSELVGEVGGVRVYDDYGHHPTAIRSTLRGFRDFFPTARIVVDFMSHTYSRSRALLDDFAAAFDAADTVVLNDIYASARERAIDGFGGTEFAAAIAGHHRDVRYCPDFDDATTEIAGIVSSGDVVLTMGAGNNASIGVALLDVLRRGEGS